MSSFEKVFFVVVFPSCLRFNPCVRVLQRPAIKQEKVFGFSENRVSTHYASHLLKVSSSFCRDHQAKNEFYPLTCITYGYELYFGETIFSLVFPFLVICQRSCYSNLKEPLTIKKSTLRLGVCSTFSLIYLQHTSFSWRADVKWTWMWDSHECALSSTKFYPGHMFCIKAVIH